VYICTGRSRAEVYDEIWDIGLDGMIGGNGSYVEDHGEILLHQLITADQCRHVVDWLHSRSLAFYLESNNGLFGSEDFETAARPSIREYCARKGKDGAGEMSVQDVFPEMIFGGELYRDDVNKVSFLLKSYQDHLDSVEEFPDLEPGTWGGKGETALFGDLGVKGITKANAIDVLLNHLGVSREDTIAFGDAKVDIAMLDCCQVGVAMGSGGDEIKAMAGLRDRGCGCRRPVPGLCASGACLKRKNGGKRMKIEHLAMYAADLEKTRDFFIKYFQASCNDGYHNKKTDFRSYFLTFDGGSRLEVMHKPQMEDPKSP